MVNHSPNRKTKTKFTSAGLDITLTSLPLYNQANLLSLAYSAVKAVFYFGSRTSDKNTLHLAS